MRRVLTFAGVAIALLLVGGGTAWSAFEDARTLGYGLPGDSGSGVMNDAGLAVGDLSHGIGVAGVPVPGLSFGTDMAGIFGLLGPGWSVVTVDGRRANCANPLGI